MRKCKSFEPSVNDNCNVLILGSMPGIKSLEKKQYYAHPCNRFWKVMGILCNKDLTNCNYNSRLKILLDNGFALWDTIGTCERDGSLDSNIKKEKPNDIRQLIKRYPNIRIICLNGNKSYNSFRKYFSEILSDKQYNIYPLPSTSTANARYQLNDLINAWEIITK